MIALKVLLFAIGQQIGSWLWPRLHAYMQRAHWVKHVAYPWMAVMLVGPLWLCRQLYPRATWTELMAVVTLPELAALVLIWALRLLQ